MIDNSTKKEKMHLEVASSGKKAHLLEVNPTV